MKQLDCVAFILIENNQFLVEKRKLSKEVDPGARTIPGGHIEDGESQEEALYREIYEELGIVPQNIKYVCSLLHKTKELHKIHYFLIESWEGKILNNEAESLQWLPLEEFNILDVDVDRVAFSEYLRVYKS